MSRERLEWTLALLDRASGPARRVARGLDAVTTAQERVARAAGGNGAARSPIDSIERGLRRRRGAREARVGRELDALTRGQREVASSGINAGAVVGGAFMAIGAAAVGAVLAVGRVTLALGQSAVAAADWRNRTEAGFRVLIGDRPALVGQAFQRASQYAQRFGLDVRDVARQMTQLTAAGFSQSEIPRVMQAAGDLGALEGPQAAERAITAFRQIRAKGKLQMEELQQQLADTGLNTGDVLAEVARMRGLRGSNQSLVNQAAALVRAGRVDSESGVGAAMAVIARRSGGRLGGTLDTQSRGAEAAMNRLRNSWLLLQSNFARSPAFARIIGFIERMASALDPASAGAQRFSAQMDRFFSTLTGVASQVDPVAVFNGIVSALGMLGRGLQAAYPYAQAWITGFYVPIAAALARVVPGVARFYSTLFGGAGNGLSTLSGLARIFGFIGTAAVYAIGLVAGVFGLLARAIAVPISTLTAFWTGLVGAFSGIELSFTGIGGAIVRGLVNGVTAAAGAAYESLRGLATGAVGAVKGALGIRSPSRVFAELGGYVAEGFAVGIDGGAAGVRSSIGSMVNVGAVGARAAANARAGSVGPLALTINVTAPEGADADEWGAAIASAVARELGTRTERAA